MNKKPLHAPGIEVSGTLYRTALCDGQRVIYLDIRKARDAKEACLSWQQSYYTTDMARVTCKLCRRKLAQLAVPRYRELDRAIENARLRLRRAAKDISALSSQVSQMRAK